MKNIIKIISVVMVLCVIASGCVKKTANNGGGNFNKELTFPLDEPYKLTYWVPIYGGAGTLSSYNDMPIYREFEKATNVKIEFIHPAIGGEKEQFNIMMASQDYPDMIDGLDARYVGKSTKAYEDGVIIPLNGLLEKHAPTLSAIYKRYPYLIPYIVNEDDLHLGVPLIYGGTMLRQASGPIFRGDYLKKVNMAPPETIDEWEKALTAFKTELNIPYPLLYSMDLLKASYFTGAWGISLDFFVENGTVKYGYYDERLKSMLTVLARWYQKGLLDPELSVINGQTIEARILNDECGAFATARGSGIGKYDIVKKGTKFEMAPVKYPVLNKGDKQTITNLNPLVPMISVSITTACKRPDIALRWLDYGYTKKGHLLNNFGIEGESYVIKDGYPRYTDIIMNNPNGKSMSEMGRKYCRSFTQGPYVHDTKYGEQAFSSPKQKEALEQWSYFAQDAEDAGQRFMGKLSTEELLRTTTKLNDISTFASEAFAKFVMGREPLDNFEKYMDELKRLGIEDIIATYQNAQDRFTEKYPGHKAPVGVDISDELFWSE